MSTREISKIILRLTQRLGNLDTMQTNMISNSETRWLLVDSNPESSDTLEPPISSPGFGPALSLTILSAFIMASSTILNTLYVNRGMFR